MSESRAVALIPARGGSKGFPGKNLALLEGRSLLQWAVDIALGCPSLGRCIVSTDDEPIARAALELGAEVHERPARLATDTSLVVDTIREVDTWLRSSEGQWEQLVLLEPTSPFRSIELVETCLGAISGSFDASATFAPASLHPSRAFRLEAGAPVPFLDGAEPWKPRQALTPPAYELTGAVYALRFASLIAGSTSILNGRVHAVISDIPHVDIDTPEDLELAHALLRRGGFSSTARPSAT